MRRFRRQRRVAFMYGLYCYFYAKRRRSSCGARQPGRTVLSHASGQLGTGCSFHHPGRIYSGVFTPTESAAVAVGYSIIVTLFITKELSWSALWNISLDTGRMTSRILIMVAAATLFSWLLTIEGITQAIVQPILAMNLPPWMLLLAANILMLLTACSWMSSPTS